MFVISYISFRFIDIAYCIYMTNIHMYFLALSAEKA